MYAFFGKFLVLNQSYTNKGEYFINLMNIVCLQGMTFQRWWSLWSDFLKVLWYSTVHRKYFVYVFTPLEEFVFHFFNKFHDDKKIRSMLSNTAIQCSMLFAISTRILNLQQWFDIQNISNHLENGVENS